MFDYRRMAPIVAIWIALDAIALAVIAHNLHFDGLYGQDPYAYYDYGTQIRDLITTGHGLGYFYWPLGYPSLIGGVFLLGGLHEAIAQTVTILFSAAGAAFSGLIAVEIGRALGFSTRMAWIAGTLTWLLIAIAGQATQSGIVIMSDMPGLAWAALSCWALLRYLRSGRSKWLALTAFALAWATMTRWQYGGLAVPWALACLLHWHWRPRWKHAGLAVFVGLLISLPQIIYTLQNPDPALHHEWLTLWSTVNAFGRDFVTPDGTFHYDQPIAVYYLLPLTSPYYLHPWLVPLTILGIALLLSHTRKQLSVVIAILGWIVAEYGFLAGIPYENIRFALAFFPPIVVLTGIGAVWVLEETTRLRSLVSGGIRSIGASVVAYTILATVFTASGLVTGFVANKDRDLAAVQWAESLIPEPNATVYTLDLALTIGHYSTLKPVQIFYETPDSMAARLPGDRPAYALINVWTTENQWSGKTPWIIYHWLLDNPGLTQIGQYSVYTLYRVN